MAARSIASLTVSFGLVSIPVKLFSATEAGRAISFNLLHKACGSRLKQQYFCLKEEVPVEREDMVKGYEFAKDQYVIFTPEELKAMEEAGTHTAEITEFVPIESIDPVVLRQGVLPRPRQGRRKPFALLATALRESMRCALGRWAARGKQYIVMIRPVEDGLIMQQLLYAGEVRSVDQGPRYPEDRGEARELKLAKQLIDAQASDKFDPRLHRRGERAHRAAVQKKSEGQEITMAEAPEGGARKSSTLMEALRASLEKKAPKPAKRKKRRRRRASRPSGRSRPSLRRARASRSRESSQAGSCISTACATSRSCCALPRSTIRALIAAGSFRRARARKAWLFFLPGPDCAPHCPSAGCRQSAQRRITPPPPPKRGVFPSPRGGGFSKRNKPDKARGGPFFFLYRPPPPRGHRAAL